MNKIINSIMNVLNIGKDFIFEKVVYVEFKNKLPKKGFSELVLLRRRDNGEFETLVIDLPDKDATLIIDLALEKMFKQDNKKFFNNPCSEVILNIDNNE